MTCTKSQSGAALLSILLIVAALAVAALMATTAIARQTDIAKTAARRADASWAAYSAEALAKSAVAELMTHTGGRVTLMTPNLGETVSAPVRGGFVSLEISDAANCFNLNSLAGADEGASTLARVGWTTLLRDLDVPANDATILANTLADWIDADANSRPGGAEDGYYLSLRPAYRAANRMMDSPRELASVMGYSLALRDALKPFVCALPDDRPARININTLSPEQAALLRATYSEALTLAAAERILMNRPEGGWPDVDSFERLPDIRAIPEGQKRTDAVSVTTGVFAVTGRTTLDSGVWPFSFLIAANSGSEPETIWRRMGEE